MKHTKLQRYLSLALSGVLLLGIVASFAACGKDSENEPSSSDYTYNNEITEVQTDENVPASEEISSTEEPATVPSSVPATDGTSSTVKETTPVKNPTTTKKAASSTTKLSKPTGTNPMTDKDEWDDIAGMPDRFQRQFGFSDSYDALASAGGMYIVNKKVIFKYRSFDPVDKLDDGTYKDKAWRIEIWKGAYGFGTTVGSEIGVYTGNPNTPHSFGKIYPCASNQNLLRISQELYYDGEKLFTTRYRNEWWDTVFVPHVWENTSKANIEKMVHVKGRIKFRDKGMCNAFTSEFEKQGFTRNSNLNVSGHYTVESDGQTVWFMW